MYTDFNGNPKFSGQFQTLNWGPGSLVSYSPYPAVKGAAPGTLERKDVDQLGCCGKCLGKGPLALHPGRFTSASP